MKIRPLYKVSSLGLIFLLTATSCGSIPTDGSVNHYADPAQSASASAADIQAQGPSQNASPEQIVRGFIEAGIGANDDYTVAREFLTPEFAQTWQPDDKTLVYGDQVNLKQGGKSEDFVVKVPVTTEIDKRGIATSFDAAENQDVNITVKQVDGQWRIASAPNAIVISRANFEKVFTPFTLYFYDSTFTYAVPDMRWFADRSTVATSLVRVLLQGPAPYLEGAVSSAVPEGTQLNRNSVPVNGGTATVDVNTAEPAANLSQLDIERFQTQLTQTLSQLNGVQAIQLSVQDQVLKQNSLDDYQAPVINPDVGPQVVGFSGKDMRMSENFRDDSNLTTIYTSDDSMQLPAMGYKRQNFAYLNAARNSLNWINSNTRKTVMMGEMLTQPSFDQFQWLWSSTSDGEVKAISIANRENQTPRTISADWLKDYTVSSLKISRDGTRAVIVTQSGGESAVWMSGIKRGSDNTPEALMKPIRLSSTGKVSDAQWYSDSSVLLADYSQGSTEIVNLSGEVNQIETLDGLASISAAPGSETALAHTQDASVYRLLDGRWSRIDISLEDANFSG